MRSLKFVAVIAMCVLVLGLVASASQNKFGVADSRNINFSAPTRVGGVLLPKGDYTVRHTMEGENHIMVFKQVKTNKPTEAKVKCQLVPLAQKALRDEQTFTFNAAKERVLHTLIFKGDSAQHVF
jgi:hypothetical protein